MSVPLKPLHPDSSLSPAKLNQIARIPTEIWLQPLKPGEKDCLKTRPDGTILDGHHRITILSSRGVEVDALPPETIVRE